MVTGVSSIKGLVCALMLTEESFVKVGIVTGDQSLYHINTGNQLFENIEAMLNVGNRLVLFLIDGNMNHNFMKPHSLHEYIDKEK